MPKISESARAARRRTIEDAALRLFRQRGYHGVSLRDICAEGGLTVGAVYAHFASKEAIFHSLIGRLYDEFKDPAQPMGRFFTDPAFPDDLEGFAEAIRAMVDRHADYLLLVFVDVVEFRGEHIREHYERLADRFGELLGPHFDRLRAEGRIAADVDPAVAFSALYMQLFNYFMVRRIFGVQDHLGPDDGAVVRSLVGLFRNGILPRAERSSR